MKRLFELPVLLALGTAAVALAQTPAAPMPSAPARAGAVPSPEVGAAKVAVVSFQAAVSQTNEFQRAFVDLEKKWDPKRQQLKALSDDIDRLTKELQGQGAKLTPEEQATKAKSLDEKKKQFDRQQQDAQDDFGQEMQELFSNTASKVYDVLSSYAQKNGFTLVLDNSNQQTPVLYWHAATDITKPVIEGYNAKSGVPPLPPQQQGNAAPGTTAPKVPSAPRMPAPKPAAPKTPPSQ
ncbi:OmpH family outer membrane protein [Acidobacteria bacterium AB60]|nr:OmpH family outer membrane protein [Acidobacteria bacterium AB60]